MSGTAEQSKRASIYDVARLAGVSHTTVSRVLHDHPRTRESTKRRVLAAIEQTSYTPSLIARALAMQRTMRMGVLVDSPVEHGPNTTLRAFEAAARRAGYAISQFSVTDDEHAGMDDAIADLVAQGVDGLCVIAPREASLDALRRQVPDLPAVVITSEPRDGVRAAGIDQREGAMRAVSHLISLGHRRILHLAGPDSWFDARARRQGWRDALTAAGLEEIPAVEGDWTSDAGYAFGRLFEPGGATAVFAANDQMALGVVRGLSEQGLRVPDDVSVVGFDDLPDAKHFLPPLTTVRQDFAELGSLAVELLLGAIQRDVGIARAVIEPRLIVRASTGPAPH